MSIIHVSITAEYLFICRHETLHKCTGVHSAVMSLENTVAVVVWKRSQNEIDENAAHGANEEEPRWLDFSSSDHEPVWGEIAKSLDADRDVLLFPSTSSTAADVFQWNRVGAEAGSAAIADDGKWRLVVLEASWLYGKSVYKKIMRYRQYLGLPPVKCVCLENVIGGYWKFHREGHGAVSSIEAIAHAAAAAGLDSGSVETLLLLFNLQKYRVLDRVKTGGRPPKAICVAGSGTGSWKSLTDSVAVADGES
jgi:hypothetical protein